jgi:hypothetical protein
MAEADERVAGVTRVPVASSAAATQVDPLPAITKNFAPRSKESA